MKNNIATTLCVLVIVAPFFHAHAAGMEEQRRNHIKELPLFYPKSMDSGISMPPVLDEAIRQIRNGKKISAETLQQCIQASTTYFSEVYFENNVQQSWDLLESDRVNVLIVQFKLAIIAPERYDYAFGDMEVMKYLQDAIKRRRLVNEDPFLTLCLIFPSVASEDFDGAVAAYKELLGKDPFLARYAVKALNVPHSFIRARERNMKFLQLISAPPAPTVRGGIRK